MNKPYTTRSSIIRAPYFTDGLFGSQALQPSMYFRLIFLNIFYF